MTARELARAERALRRRERHHQEPELQRAVLAALDLMPDDHADSHSLDLWPERIIDAGPFERIDEHYDF